MGPPERLLVEELQAGHLHLDGGGAKAALAELGHMQAQLVLP